MSEPPVVAMYMVSFPESTPVGAGSIVTFAAYPEPLNEARIREIIREELKRWGKKRSKKEGACPK